MVCLVGEAWPVLAKNEDALERVGRMEEPSAIPVARAATLMDQCGLLLPHSESQNYAGQSWQVVGRDSQLVMVNLQPGQVISPPPSL
jgi:hypothetical protein